MSGYEYYEFQAIDKNLDNEEQEKIQDLSSRARVSSTHASFPYDYGHFPGDTVKLMTQYFDVGLYMAARGVRCLMFRLPLDSVDINKLETYCAFNEFQIVHEGSAKYLLLEIYYADNRLADPQLKEGCRQWCDKLATIRAEIINGDYRPLYLAWLRGADLLPENSRAEEQAVEPPVPNGMQKLSTAQQALVSFFNIDEALLAVASGLNQGLPQISDLSPWISKLSAQEQHDFLVGFCKNEPNQLELLNKRLRELACPEDPDVVAKKNNRRNIAELRHDAIAWAVRKKEEEERRAAEQRERELEALVGNEDEIWNEVEELIQKKTASAYNEATQHLRDLHDLAQLLGEPEYFSDRMQSLAESCANQPAMLGRMREANLLD